MGDRNVTTAGSPLGRRAAGPGHAYRLAKLGVANRTELAALAAPELGG
ncbi:hypothetical protein PAI11_28260 [Patulibacter medicamentivorans]|uniref:Uncharacterized protein n=1 Tax=Patulibacter medicamentivorans TaxID=1097667 RepID=H0E7M2_9ACTN|nr:hypothetical protein PAI11_28260 [Patulibacter medicamentivorans]